MKTRMILVGLLIVVCVGVALADDIKGYIVPEYYVVGSHHTGDDGIEGQNGFWIRRIYFGYNTNLGNGWSARLRLEMNSVPYEEVSIVPYVKNAHLKKKLGGGASLIVGIQEPPSFNKIEKWWGIRFLEKTAPDFFKLASSRDFGAAIDGKTKGGLVYTAMVGNHSSNKGEDNKGKAFYGRLGYEQKNYYLEANGHFASDSGKDITYLTAFAGLKGSWGRCGAGYHYKSESPEEGDSNNTGIITGFGVLNIGKKTEVFARYDYFTDRGLKNIDGYVPIPAKDWESRFLIAGLNFKVHKMIQITPNVKYVMYDGYDAPGNDFHFNLTAKFSFNTKIGK